MGVGGDGGILSGLRFCGNWWGGIVLMDLCNYERVAKGG